MARTTGTVSLSDLLRQGSLREGERLRLSRRSAPPIEGVLQADGSIKVGAQVFKTASAAAKAALNVQAADGWLRWRVPRLDDQTLAAIRDATR